MTLYYYEPNSLNQYWIITLEVLALIIHTLHMRPIGENSTGYFSNLKNALPLPPVSNKTSSFYT